VRRLRQEEGFGLLELLMAMVMLNVGILAIVGAFNSGALALSRASTRSTASAIGEQQMELFRGMKYVNIVQTQTDWNSAVADSTWTADSVYQQNMASPQAPKALISPQTTCPVSTTNACDPSFTVTGPDNRSYRVDTYMYYDQPRESDGSAIGGQIKVVYVIVRNQNDFAHSLARIVSTFDSSIGS
jgi:Tfp pilus assembly protein PilV